MVILQIDYWIWVNIQLLWWHYPLNIFLQSQMKTFVWNQVERTEMILSKWELIKGDRKWKWESNLQWYQVRHTCDFQIHLRPSGLCFRCPPATSGVTQNHHILHIFELAKMFVQDGTLLPPLGQTRYLLPLVNLIDDRKLSQVWLGVTDFVCT